jgi:hypothetical protein
LSIYDHFVPGKKPQAVNAVDRRSANEMQTVSISFADKAHTKTRQSINHGHRQTIIFSEESGSEIETLLSLNM